MASQSKDHGDHGQKEEVSLTTLLSATQRTELIILLATVTATMREAIENNFEASVAAGPQKPEPENATEETSKDAAAKDLPAQDPNAPNPNADAKDVDASYREQEQRLLALRERELSEPKIKELKDAALKFFDAWRETMIKRVGEVVNPPAKATAQLGNPSAAIAAPSPAPDTTAGASKAQDESTALHKLYPPVPTPLAALEENSRILILHSMLLLLLSLEHYTAPSRILLLYLASALHLPLCTLRTIEESTAHSLLTTTKALSGTAETQAKAHENAKSLAWKVGFASVAGAAVIGITGGLAAPLVAVGIGTVMEGLGLGATAAAGYLGTMAGSSLLVGSLFGAYGAGMSGRMMDEYAREVRDFAFLPVRSSAKKGVLHHGGATADASSEDADTRRLRVTIGISGWLTEKEGVVVPWRVIGHGAEVFALRFELEALLKLGNSLVGVVGSAAWKYAKKEILERTVLADMMLALWPLELLEIGKVVDNPFNVAKARANKAGQLLADALVNRAQGERPVTLVGYSLGARVIYVALMELARRRAFGLVESAVLLGTPAPSAGRDWRAMRAVVAGRLVNVYSTNDYVLGFLYRTSSIHLGVAGLQTVDGVPGVENVDASGVVSGHLRYRFLVGSLLKEIGLEDVVEEEVEREEAALAALAEGEEAGKGGEESAEKSILQRTMEGLHLGKEDKDGAKGSGSGKGEAATPADWKSYVQKAKDGLHMT
jgi:ribosomal protein L30E